MKKILLIVLTGMAAWANCGEPRLVERAGSDQNEFFHLAGDIESFEQYTCHIKVEPKEIKEERCLKTLAVHFNKEGNILDEIIHVVPDEFVALDETVGFSFLDKPTLFDYDKDSAVKTIIEYDNRGNRILLSLDYHSQEIINFEVERKIASRAEIFTINDPKQSIDYQRTRTYGGDKYVSSDNEVIIFNSKTKRTTNREFEYSGLSLGEVAKVTTTIKNVEKLLPELTSASLHKTTKTYKYDSEGYMIAEDIELKSEYSSMPGEKKRLLQTFDIYEKDPLNWTKRLVIWEKEDGKSRPVFFEKRKIKYRD